MSGVARTIVGVMPDAFEFPGSGEVWLPFTAEGTPGLASGRTFGVLRSGVDPAAADAEIAALSKQFEASDPGAPKVRIVVMRFTDAVSRGLELLSAVLVLPGHVRTGMPSPPRTWRRAFDGLFADYRPVTAAAASRTVLEAIRRGDWRVVIGADAEAIDDRIRADPWTAYD